MIFSETKTHRHQYIVMVLQYRYMTFQSSNLVILCDVPYRKKVNPYILLSIA